MTLAPLQKTASKLPQMMLDTGQKQLRGQGTLNA